MTEFGMVMDFSDSHLKKAFPNFGNGVWDSDGFYVIAIKKAPSFILVTEFGIVTDLRDIKARTPKRRLYSNDNKQSIWDGDGFQ